MKPWGWTMQVRQREAVRTAMDPADLVALAAWLGAWATAKAPPVGVPMAGEGFEVGFLAGPYSVTLRWGPGA